jgi:tetratricopeptide (TPR) repeat protein
MKLLISTAAGLAALASTTAAAAQPTYGNRLPTAPQQQAPAKGNEGIKVSAKARNAIAALQKAVNANDKAQIPALLAAAQAASTTKEDRWFVAQLQLRAAVVAADTAGMAAAVDAIAATGVTPAAEMGGLYAEVANKLYNAEQYAQAAALYEKSAKLNPSNIDVQNLLGQSYLLGNQPAQALAVAQRLIAADIAAGRKPEESNLRLAVQSAFNAKSPQLSDYAQQWLANYPSADAWRNNLIIYRSSANLDENGRLALLRLTNATGGLKTAEDYNSYIGGLLLLSNFNEAHAVLDQAIAANVLTSSSPQAVAVNGKPKASVADLTAAAKTAQSGAALLRIGDRLYGTGEYAKAAEIYQQAKAKGVDAGTADLFTGIALAKAGDKDGAKIVLTSVSGAHAAIAKYWLLYLGQ